ncbi:MAG TPA: outer membrane beta-barrel protein, partial [Longimicrobiales bacterium]|nr:outer membrane beta-barrel protein [Longimicrobiales bacterium]
VGYQFGISDFTADQSIYPAPNPLVAANSKYYDPQSDIRNSYSHYLYAGVDHDFSHKLRGSLRAGGQLVDYYNVGETEISPYLDATLTYVYLPGSSLQLGARHTRNATDVAAPANKGKGRPTLDQETTAVYAQVLHRVTERFTASVLGQVQFSSFTGGAADQMNEALYLLGVNLEYRLNQHWSFETGYNYDMLDSDLRNGRFEARSYDRNRVYVGVRATY